MALGNFILWLKSAGGSGAFLGDRKQKHRRSDAQGVRPVYTQVEAERCGPTVSAFCSTVAQLSATSHIDWLCFKSNEHDGSRILLWLCHLANGVSRMNCAAVAALWVLAECLEVLYTH